MKQGYRLVTEGEFGRDWWHSTFMEHLLGAEGYVPEPGYNFANQETDPYDVRLVRKGCLQSKPSILPTSERPFRHCWGSSSGEVHDSKS